MRKNYPRILQVLIFPYTINSNPGCTAKKPREETEFGVAESDVSIETNAKRIGKVSFLQYSSLHINKSISNHVFLCKGQFKLNRKKISDETHALSVYVSARNVERVFVYQVIHGRA